MTIAHAHRSGWRATRFLGALLVSGGLLAGCALVDDARREVGSGADPRADPAASAPRSATATSTATTPSPDGSPSGCPPSGTLVRPGPIDAAMGLRAMRIELVNCGTVPVTVDGYPEVRVLDDDRAPLPVTVLRGSSQVAGIDNFDTPPAPVTAAPGERLVAGLVWRNRVDTGTDPVNGTYLEVVPVPGQPPQTVRPVVPRSIGCSGRLGVTAWGRARR